MKKPSVTKRLGAWFVHFQGNTTARSTWTAAVEFAEALARREIHKWGGK